MHLSWSVTLSSTSPLSVDCVGWAGTIHKLWPKQMLHWSDLAWCSQVILTFSYLLFSQGCCWEGRCREGCSREGCGGESSSWEGSSWEGSGWEGRSWEGRSWEGSSWEGSSWEGRCREGSRWKGSCGEGRSRRGSKVLNIQNYDGNILFWHWSLIYFFKQIIKWFAQSWKYKKLYNWWWH